MSLNAADAERQRRSAALPPAGKRRKCFVVNVKGLDFSTDMAGKQYAAHAKALESQRTPFPDGTGNPSAATLVFTSADE